MARMNLDAPEPDASETTRATPPASEAGDLRLEPIGPRRDRPRRTGLWIAGAAALALACVLAVGLALPGDPPDMAPPGAETLDIQVAERPAATAPPSMSGAPLDVLPQDMAEAAPHNPPPEPAPQPDLAQAPEAPPFAAADLRQPASLAFSPSFDCRRARTPAERVVCADPVLAQADQQLAAAYEQALAAGIPDWRLERQQRRWLRAREDAAREAPAAVAEVYAARIAELEDQAALAPPEEPIWPPSW
ncbi:lysozyme inhibitor LprI family protein [Phenylobacterium sp.]|uniref:lysozyme inhibitor LprI family protein n=1 Tax=Phenylobacterium sp. TaxID=1871053 RepID=UPI002730D9A4|nr:lysozyme inhibitor LprI family protein [Phenylobacterium sp.]MDP1872665.1 hypothetical protein [Phenylobacterium sp.]MDP3300057.1 hypothetical protein [Phenylobacterium sp.]